MYLLVITGDYISHSSQHRREDGSYLAVQQINKGVDQSCVEYSLYFIITTVG